MSNSLETTLSRGRRAQLARLGLSATDLGRLTNRAAPPAQLDSTDTIPDTPEALKELLGDAGKVATYAKAGKLPAVIEAYARKTLNKDASLAEQVETQVKGFLTKYLKDNEPSAVRRLNLANAVPAPGGSAERSAAYNPKAMGAKLDEEWEGRAGEFFQTIWHKGDKTENRQAAVARIRNAWSSSVPSEGGFLIPETLRSEMLRIALETAIVRPRARVIPMESLTVPFPVLDATSNVNSVFGGVVAYWTEEGQAMTASSASFGRVVLAAKKLTAYTEVPDELLADSVGSLDSFIREIFPEALAWYEDDAFINGSGVGMPLGIIDAQNTAAITVAKRSGQAADTIVWENIIDMYSRMLPGSLNRAVWLTSPGTFVQLATMALEVGTGGSAIWLTNGVSGPPMTILGRPVIITEKVPTLGNRADIAFVDFGHYLVGDRQAMSASSSEHYKFGEGKTAYRIISRVDGRPWLQSAITPKNNGDTLSPFVFLDERA